MTNEEAYKIGRRAAQQGKSIQDFLWELKESLPWDGRKRIFKAAQEGYRAGSQECSKEGCNA